MASTFTTVQFMDPPGGPGVTGAVKAGSGIAISADGTISTQQGGGIVKTVTGTNGVTTAGTTDVIVSLNPPTASTIGGVRTVDGSGISIDSLGVIRSIAQFSILAGTGISVTNVTPISSTVSVNPAGVTAGSRGGVWLDLDSGLSVTSSGALSVAPATTTKIGGVKVGSGLSITPDGTLTVAGGSGTITGVIAGTGLTGGGSTGSVTLNLSPPSATVIGGVKAGQNITIDPDGTINSAAASSGVASVSGASPIIIGGTTSNPIVNIQAASTAASGAVQLYEGLDSTSSVLAATANSVRLANAEALTKLPLAGGTLLGDVTFAGTQTFPGVVADSAYSAAGAILVGSGASTYSALPLGAEGQVLTVSGGAVTWGTQLAANALLTTGGTMTGDITFAGTQSFPGVVSDTSFLGSGDILVGTGSGTYGNLPKGSNGQVLTVSGGAVSWQSPSTDFLQLSGGTMTGTINFAAGQTISGYVANSLFSTTGDMVVAASASSPSRLPVGASGTILGVNGGLPAWRTALQLGLLTTAAASSTYAPINTPTFTGPVTINAGAGGGANGLILSGGNLVLSTSWEPASSADVGSTGEIAWGGGYMYFCYAPNQWGRIAIDLTPF